MKAKLIRRAMRDNGPGKPETRLEIGHIHERHDAYLLVHAGMAVPEDDECRKACGMTDAQIAEVVKAQNAVSKGIAPEDYDKFHRGEILGYNEDGSYIPGPNAVPEIEEGYEDDE
jgi:hypothetical protein